MREFLDKSIAHTKATKVRNIIEEFIKNEVALKDVNDVAESLTAKIKGYRNRENAKEKIKKVAMRAKLEDSRRNYQRTKYEMKKTKENLGKIVRIGTFVRNLYMQIVKFENERVWKMETKKYKKKLEINRERK